MNELRINAQFPGFADYSSLNWLNQDGSIEFFSGTGLHAMIIGTNISADTAQGIAGQNQAGGPLEVRWPSLGSGHHKISRRTITGTGCFTRFILAVFATANLAEKLSIG